MGGVNVELLSEPRLPVGDEAAEPAAIIGECSATILLDSSNAFEDEWKKLSFRTSNSLKKQNDVKICARKDG